MGLAKSKYLLRRKHGIVRHTSRNRSRKKLSSRNEAGSSWDNVEHVSKYCETLIFVRFFGQTNSFEEPDIKASSEQTDLGINIARLDEYLRMREPHQINVKHKKFVDILRLIANDRHHDDETCEQCFKGLLEDAVKFQEIYQQRARKHTDMKTSESLGHQEYWGTRQQLLSGKVICDWLNYDDEEPMDPIFGVLLNPTAGRVGPDDSGWVHSLLYDDFGIFAYHSAVHDAFGYLITCHDCGPGYDYMYNKTLAKVNVMAGQFSGLQFWREKLSEVGDKLKVISAFKNI